MRGRQLKNAPALPSTRAIPGSQPLPVISRLGSGGLLTNATILNLIRQNQVGELAATYVGANRNTFMNTAQPCIETGVGRPCPSFFLPATVTRS